jgi:hypothetical protein
MRAVAHNIDFAKYLSVPVQSNLHHPELQVGPDPDYIFGQLPTTLKLRIK